MNEFLQTIVTLMGRRDGSGKQLVILFGAEGGV
jgi:hypothetical protein